MIEVESNFNPKTVSPAGAMGLMQLMPANVKEMGVKNPFSPAESIEGGVKELSGYLKKHNGDLVLALASYNAGPGNVRKYGGVPPFKETQGYIKNIEYRRFKIRNFIIYRIEIFVNTIWELARFEITR